MEQEATSDTEISVDSLEDVSTYDSKINLQVKDKICFGSTDSLLVEEGLKKNTKVECMTAIQDESKTSSRSKESHLINSHDKRNAGSKGSDVYNEGSYFFSDAARSQSARIPSIRRIARRLSVCIEPHATQRIRHRSVSYLEQFKKKYNSETNDIGLATLTMPPSEPTELTSMSCASNATVKSVVKTDTSEFEFYEGIAINDNSNVLNSMREEIKHKVIQENRKGVSKQRKGQSTNHELIQPNRDIKHCNEDHFDKRKAMEKRDEYSKKVQLRNQIKANRQKEIEKTIKFKNSPFKSHPGEQGLFIRQPREKPLPFDPNDISMVPFLINQLDLSSRTRSESCAGKTLTKQVKTKTKTKTQKTSTEICKLSILQKRHESEKTIVDSIRNSFINR